MNSEVKNKMIELYKGGMSGAEVAIELGFKHSNSVRQILKKLGVLRTQSESSRLAVKNGKKDKSIEALVVSAKTINRFNPKKAHYGEDHPKWISDRSLIKQRAKGDEKLFFKELMSDREYKCELTGHGGRLSVHHIKGVWSNPELKFSKENCIVILSHIHNKFHKMYGFRTTKDDWDNYVSNDEFKDDYLFRVKKRYVPFEDKTGKKYGRLIVLEKINKKWKCLCDCGNVSLVDSSNLNSGKTNSCGCLDRERKSERIKRLRIWEKSPCTGNDKRIKSFKNKDICPTKV